MSGRRVGVALLGYGTVGQGVAALVGEHHSRWLEGLGVDVQICHVVVRSPGTPRDVTPPVPLTTDVAAAVADPTVDVVIEVNGEVEENRTVLAGALRRGVHVVTANKALLSAHLEELTEAARDGGARLLYEAAVAGGVPVVRALRDLARVDTVTGITGILNGSCNHILTAMTREGRDYAEVVEEAQRLGFLEADPSADVSGLDARRKLRILATLAFGGPVLERDVEVTGIERITADDIDLLAASGREPRLLGTARRTDGTVTAVVEPVAVRSDGAWATVTGSTNAVALHATHVGDLTFTGPGAGRYETASAVLTDLVDILLDAVPAASPLGARALTTANETITAQYYVRCGDAALAEALRPLLAHVLTETPLTGVTHEATRVSLAPWRSHEHCTVMRWDA